MEQSLLDLRNSDKTGYKNLLKKAKKKVHNDINGKTLLKFWDRDFKVDYNNIYYSNLLPEQKAIEIENLRILLAFRVFNVYFWLVNQ